MSDRCDMCGSTSRVKSVQMSVSRGMTPPEWADMCDRCRALRERRHVRQIEAEKQADI